MTAPMDMRQHCMHSANTPQILSPIAFSRSCWVHLGNRKPGWSDLHDWAGAVEFYDAVVIGCCVESYLLHLFSLIRNCLLFLALVAGDFLRLNSLLAKETEPQMQFRSDVFVIISTNSCKKWQNSEGWCLMRKQSSVGFIPPNLCAKWSEMEKKRLSYFCTNMYAISKQ